MPNRVKNDYIFDIVPVKPFPRNKSTRPIHFALKLVTESAGLRT